MTTTIVILIIIIVITFLLGLGCPPMFGMTLIAAVALCMTLMLSNPSKQETTNKQEDKKIVMTVDNKEKIADIEKQIDELQKELDELKGE